MLVLDTHDTTTPDSAEFLVVVVLGLELLAHSIKVSNILLADISHSNASSGLHVAEFTKGSLSTDEAEGDTLLSAESWEVDNHLDWVNIVSNYDELGSVFLDESGNVVKTKLKVDWLGGLATATLSFLLKTVFLLSSGLWAVFGEQF